MKTSFQNNQLQSHWFVRGLISLLNNIPFLVMVVVVAVFWYLRSSNYSSEIRRLKDARKELQELNSRYEDTLKRIRRDRLRDQRMIDVVKKQDNEIQNKLKDSTKLRKDLEAGRADIVDRRYDRAKLDSLAKYYVFRLPDS